jgi:hypothetical protein
MMVADPNRWRLKAAHCLELAAKLPTDAAAAEQLRLFAAEFVEMATQLELASTTVLFKKPPTEQ